MNVNSKRVTLRAALVAALIAATLAGAPTAANAATPVTFTAVGDSITTWLTPYRYDPRSTWVTAANTTNVQLVGGYARSAAKFEEMEANLVPTESDVFVLLVGITELPRTDGRAGTPLAEKFAALDNMIATMNEKHVLLVAVPPFSFGYKGALSWNKNLARYAAAHGYSYLDPWVQFRTSTGRWVDGASRSDKVHPLPATSAVAGKIIRKKIVEIATAG